MSENKKKSPASFVETKLTKVLYIENLRQRRANTHFSAARTQSFVQYDPHETSVEKKFDLAIDPLSFLPYQNAVKLPFK